MPHAGSDFDHLAGALNLTDIEFAGFRSPAPNLVGPFLDQPRTPSLHRAFEPALIPLARFIIKRLSDPDSIVFDPDLGLGQITVEAALLRREVYAASPSAERVAMTAPLFDPPTRDQAFEALDRTFRQPVPTDLPPPPKAAARLTRLSVAAQTRLLAAAFRGLSDNPLQPDDRALRWLRAATLRTLRRSLHRTDLASDVWATSEALFDLADEIRHRAAHRHGQRFHVNRDHPEMLGRCDLMLTHLPPPAPLGRARTPEEAVARWVCGFPPDERPAARPPATLDAWKARARALAAAAGAAVKPGGWFALILSASADDALNGRTGSLADEAWDLLDPYPLDRKAILVSSEREAPGHPSGEFRVLVCQRA